MHQNEFTIIGLGELLWDVFPDGKKFGGAPANFAFHAQNLGAKACIISAVGNDKLGHEIIEHLHSIQLRTEYVYTDQIHDTGTVEVRLDDKGKPDYVIHKDVAWDFIPRTPAAGALIAKADAVCFGSLAQRSPVSRETIQHLLTSAPAKCLKVFDINLRQNFYDRETIKKNLELCNCLKLNDEELPVLMDYFSLKRSEPEAVEQLVADFDLSLVALTRGSDGSLLFDRKDVSELETPEVKVADTVGAGDSFTAGMVMGYLHNQPLKKIHENATRLAAYVCTQSGATPALPAKLKADLLNFR